MGTGHIFFVPINDVVMISLGISSITYLAACFVGNYAKKKVLLQPYPIGLLS